MSLSRYTIATINGEWQVRGNPDGAWVRIEDALPLEAEVARLTERLKESDDERVALKEHYPRLRADLAAARDERDHAQVYLSVLNGTACAEEQADGNGRCGVCTTCLRAERDGLAKALRAMYDEYEGVDDMAVPTVHQSEAAKRAESLARAALAALPTPPER